QFQIDPWLSSQKFFHGYLMREDLPSLLQNHGDFLVRCNETHNVIVQTATENKVKKYFFDPREKFPTIKGLITHYTETPIVVELTLKRGIRLAKWEYSPQSVQVGKLITTATYGEIREGKLTKTDGTVIDVAIKVVRTSLNFVLSQKYSKTKEMVKEARLMRGLNHTNIVRFYGVCLLEQPIYLLFELLSGGPLDVYLMEHKHEISKDERLQMVMSVGWGLEYLHSNAILHRDIAAKSCSYSVGKLVKISEFGLSRQGTSYSMKTARKMSIKWMAPESLRTLMFTQKSDVYSYGVNL
ncbi:hypothetical protein Angca_002209, partial [Angiostrongylus cantonensis]